MELLKLLSASEVVAQVISFLLLFFILRIFAWKPLLKILDERKAKIASDFKAIEDAKQGVEKLRLEYQARIDAAGVEAQAKVKEAIEEGRKLTEELRKGAYQEAQKIIENARADIKYELSRAKDELKDQIIDLSIRAAETVIQDKLTEEEDRKIVENFLDKIDTIE
jgi:F-type H+-transporting ATPase subunit b